MTFGRSLVWSLSALTAAIACTAGAPPLLEFPSLSDDALTEQLRAADEWAVFLEGADTGTDARISTNQRL